ncbi:MAG: hypothetical protein JO257_24460 [Deltaproteobacteria bacterium]|nr:hypothetical protein [Deltaproteobacteria bacterium]
MRVLLACSILAACGGKPAPQPPKAPNNELIVGSFERHPPDGTQVLAFRGDGSFELFHDRAAQDKGDAASSGHFTIEADQLTFTNEKGLCADGPAKTATYKVVVSKLGIHFTKAGDDGCDRRATIDGQTWHRFK